MYQYFPVADVSTNVLDDADLNLLDGLATDERNFGPLHIVADFTYGWLISIQQDRPEFEEMIEWAIGYGFGPKFEELMRSLHAYKFCYVRLDTEGLTTEIQPLPSDAFDHMEADQIRRAGNHG